MAQVSRATWNSSLTTKINDNTSGDVTPQDVREVLVDLEDSVPWYDEVQDLSAADIAAMSQDWRGQGSETLIAATAALEAAASAGVSDGDKGDITVSSTGTVWTVDDEAITLAKMAHMATGSLLGRSTAGAGDVEVLAASAVRTLLNVEDGADVTDAASVTAAGALMDSEMTDLAGVKALDTSTLAGLGANTFTGTQDFNGQQVEGMIGKVVTGVLGTLTAAAHSGNILVSSGNITVPTTAGFQCVIIAGGAHTVTFNSTTSAAMASGDIMTVMVQNSTTIHAVLTAAADKVSFT